jgi:hypothetical protein
MCFVGAAALIIARSPLLAQPACPGDCNGDGMVAVNELVIIVDIGLGNMALSQCRAADVDGNGIVMINEMVDAVDAALNGCPPTHPTATATSMSTPISTADSSSTPTPPSATPVGASCGNGGAQFSSTYAAIQQQIFQNHGCTLQACHGTATNPQGSLDLLPDVAYQNLFQQPSSESGLLRLDPGEELKSYLYLKLLAGTNPSAVPAGAVSGSAMPFGLPPLSAAELDALRLWIVSGAPQTGTVEGTEAGLNACLPTPQPLVITPLDPPPTGTGVQFAMPEWPLEAHSEHENCFATYYDITAQVPPQYQDPKGQMFRFSAQELRMDPQSHHMILNRFVGDASNVHDPSYGTWTCRNNPATAGQTCEPTDLASCGPGGVCTSEIQKSFACIGFGPQIQQPPFYAIGGAQKAQFSDDYPSGVYAQIPMKGILYWNSHAFNLTDQDTVMHGRLNYYFSNNDQLPVQPIFDKDDIFGMSAAPYTTQTICNTYGPLPQGARLFELSSHTHKHGQHFTVCAKGQPSSTMGSGSGECSGPLLYDSRIYNDPVNQEFNPPLAFDSPDPSMRTLQYCSFYNNGVATDGSPDTNLVERASLIPPSAVIGHCKPVACVAGQIGTACKGASDNHTCDSSPGANDGVCDACRLTGGESTENDMFIFIGSYYVDPTASGQSGTSAVPALSAEGHSLSTELTLPMQASCACSYTAQAAMLSAQGAADK